LDGCCHVERIHCGKTESFCLIERVLHEPIVGTSPVSDQLEKTCVELRFIYLLVENRFGQDLQLYEDTGGKGSAGIF